MPSRFLKHFLYGALYLAIIAGVGYWLISSFIESQGTCFDNKRNQGEEAVDCGGPCIACALKQLKPVEVISTTMLKADSKTITLIMKFRNPNSNYGAASFSYDLQVVDSLGNERYKTTRDSYIYPGEIKTVIEAGIAVDSYDVDRVQVSARDFVWRSSDDFSKPKAQTRDLRFEVQEQEKKVNISGIIANREAYRLSRVTISVVALDNLGASLGASKTLLESIAPFGEQPFTVIVPVGDFSSWNRDLTEIFVEARR